MEANDKLNVRTSKKQILVVDDEPMNVFLIKQILKSYHFKLTVAVNGKEAVDKFKKSKFDLILMDLNMPVMDGYEATKQIRAISSLIPIIVISAAVLNTAKLKLATGIDYYVEANRR